MQNTRLVKRFIHLPSIDAVKPINNYCVLRRLTDNMNKTTESGVYLASEQINENQYLDDYSNRVYEVVAVPDKITLYNRRNNVSGIGSWWDTDIQIDVGDVVWTSFPSVLDVDVIRTPQEDFYLIRYQELRMAKKIDGSYVMLNGWNLYKRVEQKIDTTLIDPGIRKHINRKIGTIIRTGSPNRKYHRTNKKTKKSRWLDLDAGIVLSEGLVFVKTDPDHELILENPEFAVYPEKDVYLIQRKDVVAVAV